VVRARTGPFDPMAVTRKYVALCKQYHVRSATGDRYGKRWVQHASRDLLGTYHESSLYAWQLYLEALPLFNRGLVELPDLPQLVREFKSLQRVAGRTGKESVQHPRGCHDDMSNSTVGCPYLLSAVASDEPPIVTPFIYSKTSGVSSDPNWRYPHCRQGPVHARGLAGIAGHA
jgi:hypothetical protein